MTPGEVSKQISPRFRISSCVILGKFVNLSKSQLWDLIVLGPCIISVATLPKGMQGVVPKCDFVPKPFVMLALHLLHKQNKTKTTGKKQ